MPTAKILKVSAVLLCAAIYCYSAVNTNRSRVQNVSVALDKPMSIVWPCEISIVGEMGEKGLRIAPNIGMGWRGEAGGEATYRFYIPQQGKYHIWAYCLWFDECANAIFTQIDDMDKAILGNDPLYNQWHWVRGFDIDLDKGTHSMLLSNHSDHIAVQTIFFTNSANVTPQGSTVVFADIFYDGFDGCDRGNFPDWDIVSGQWSVMNPSTQVCYIENALVGSSDTEALIIYQNDDWFNYSLDLAVKLQPAETAGGSAAVCFGVKDSSEYHQLTWRLNDNADTAIMKIACIKPDRTKVLNQFEIPWNADKWHQIGVSLNEGRIIVTVDDCKPIETPVNYQITGGIGLHLQGKTTTFFDDIHVRAAERM